MKLKLILIILTLAMLVGCASPDMREDGEGNEGAGIIHITAENFETEVQNSGKTVLLDFYADWCGPCKRLAPVLEEIALERPDVIVGKIDIDVQGELAERFEIEVIPTLIVIKNGEVKYRVEGVRSKAEILSML